MPRYVIDAPTLGLRGLPRRRAAARPRQRKPARTECPRFLIAVVRPVTRGMSPWRRLRAEESVRRKTLAASERPALRQTSSS